MRNQIDYILIGRRWRTAILVTKTRPSADCGSDHQLLVAKLKIKFRQKKRRSVHVILRHRDNTSRVQGRSDEHACGVAKGGI